MKKRLLFFLITSISILSVFDLRGNTEAKARYYYLQGSLEAASKNLAAAYEYYKKAYELDSTYKDASFNYGSHRLLLHNDTLQSKKEILKSLEMMKDYVDSNPLDLYATQMYGYVTTALDTVSEAIRVYERTYELMPGETNLLLQLADSYMHVMNGRDALGALERYEKIEGKSKDISLKKISIKLALNDTTAALEEVNELVASNPKDPYSHILRGNLYEVVNIPDSVLASYKRAEHLAPDNGGVKMSLASYYRSVGDSIMLDNMMYEALLSEDFELEDKLGILGDYLQKLLEESGDKTRGDYLFTVLQQQYPHEPQVQDMAARYAGAKGDYAAARDAIEYAINMDPTNETYRLMLMSFYLTENKFKEAIEEYERASEHMTPTSQLKHLYSAAASLLDDEEESIRIINSLLTDVDPRLNPATATQEDLKNVRQSLHYDDLEWVSNLYCILGDINLKNKKEEEGFREYENALYFLGDNALALNNYAYFLSEANRDLEKAKKMSRRSLDLNEDNPTYLDTYAWILFKMGDYREAKEYIELALELAEKQQDDNEEYQIHYEAIKKALGED